MASHTGDRPGRSRSHDRWLTRPRCGLNPGFPQTARLNTNYAPYHAFKSEDTLPHFCARSWPSPCGTGARPRRLRFSACVSHL